MFWPWVSLRRERDRFKRDRVKKLERVKQREGGREKAGKKRGKASLSWPEQRPASIEPSALLV